MKAQVQFNVFVSICGVTEVSLSGPDDEGGAQCSVVLLALSVCRFTGLCVSCFNALTVNAQTHPAHMNRTMRRDAEEEFRSGQRGPAEAEALSRRRSD